MRKLAPLHTIKDLEQLRALCHPMRLEIIEHVSQQALTVTEVARLVSEPANRVYYHVMELERAKLLRAVRTRKRGNLVEKFYQTVAANIRVDERLFFRGGSDGLDLYHETIRTVLDATSLDLRRLSARKQLNEKLLEKTIRAFNVLRLRPEDIDELHVRLRCLIDEFKGREEPGVSSKAAFTVVFYPYPDSETPKRKKKP